MLVQYDTSVGRRLGAQSAELGAMEERLRRQRSLPTDLRVAALHRTRTTLERVVVVAHTESGDDDLTALANQLLHLERGGYAAHHDLARRVWLVGWAVLARSLTLPASRLRRLLRLHRPRPGESLASAVLRALLRSPHTRG